MEQLFLEDLEGMSEKGIKKHIRSSYETDSENVNDFEFLIAYESVGSWGCDSSSWFLMKNKNTGELFENHGSHCSCYGFEGQWSPESTTKEYLQSDHFYFSTGGYDGNRDNNTKLVKEYISKL